MVNHSSASKTPATQLIKDTAGSFHTYIGKGVSVPGIGDIDTDPSLNVNDLESLLRVHFVLTGSTLATGTHSSPEVVPFIKALPDHIRRLNRSTYQESELVAGGVDGRIDWGETVEMYSRRGFVDGTKFICNQHRTEYDTPENQVLKRLLLEIHSVFQNELEATTDDPESYQWLSEWLKKPGLLTTLTETLYQNVYLDDVSPSERIPQRILRTVKSSRQSLYRDAASLLEQYYSFQNRNFEREKATDILQNVYIRPNTDNGGRLFEIYWLFKILDEVTGGELQIIRSGTDLIARWEAGGSQYDLYHHTTGPDMLSFSVHSADVESQLHHLEDHFESMNYFQRTHTVQRDTAEIAETALGSSTHKTLWTGVPDILLVRTNPDNELTGILIGEVKYSRDVQYIKDGVEELLEYLYHLHYNGDYIVTPSPTDANFESEIPVVGALFVDKLPPETDDSELPISLVEYGDSYIPFPDNSS
ncbi:hypothetical protein [Natronomonas marina]|uniref:hypothetical protein n=1 Tax=Natronomonas marina TaxID=2961939 RepID=UPI0020C9EC23|nr:hypothetical protein [Natronomonas marina]